MFETLIVQPIFNVLAIIYALIPGHDFGVAVVIFTVLVRLALWPLLRRQLHQTRMIRSLQPEIKKIKEKTKGDKQKEGQLLMELYKERGVNPFGTIGILFVQLPILFGLFRGLRLVASDAHTLVDLTYPWVHKLGFIQDLTADINNFDPVSFGGAIDLTRSAFSDAQTYVPALILAVLAAIFQFYQTKTMTPDSDDRRSVRDILKSEAKGDKTEQAEINAAVGRNMRYLFPVLTFLFASRVASALALYWTTSSLVGIIQQRSVLNKDVDEMEEVSAKSAAPSKSKKTTDKTKKSKNTTTSSNKRKKRKK